jgi:hypothetical protein
MSPAKRRFGAALLGLVAVVVGTAAFGASAQAAPYIDQPTLSVSDQTPALGGTLTVTGANYLPGAVVTLTLHTVVSTLGTATPDASGAFSTSVTLPAGVAGAHTIVGAGSVPNDTASVAIVIGGSGAGGVSVGGGSGGGLAATGVAVIGIGALGVVLLIGGGVLLLAGKRRRVSVSA